MSYRPDIVLPENPDDKYKVDLVHTTDDDQEHRLTLAQYTSWGEAEEHLTELQINIETTGLDAIAEDIERLQQQSKNPLPYTFGDDQQPINGDGKEIPHHVDGGGTVHWFDRVGSRTPDQSPYELRYFRAYELGSGNIRRDSYPIMPLAEDDPNLAWPLHGLDMYLKKGDVFMAQQFAKDVAYAYDQPFPNPMELPTLNPEPHYYFGYGVGPSNLPSLEAVKTWMDGTERRFDILTIEEYGTFDQAAVDERELEQLRRDEGLESAMNLAEIWAGANGHLDRERDDPRIFFEDNSPVDPFLTDLQKDLIALGHSADLSHVASELETEEMPVVQVDPPVGNPYWRLETVRANNPDGEQIGHALQMVVYPHVKQPTDEVGAPNIPDDEPFQILEMAHFETPEDADKFSKEFRGYLVPRLLDGPELAEEVARLEAHPVEWKTLDGEELDDYRNMAYVITHDVENWKLYSPHAERDARLQMEGTGDEILISKSENKLYSGNDNIDWDL